jgi:hypothetical protein
VAREVQEEAGVVVRDVTYVASQPWPFPSSLMIGCHSLTDDPTLTVDTTELEEARWFTRAEVRAALDGEEGPFIAPRRTRWRGTCWNGGSPDDRARCAKAGDDRHLVGRDVPVVRDRLPPVAEGLAILGDEVAATIASTRSN